MKKFALSASYAAAGGADGIEIHAAHGYLINEFLSPRANHRSDEYGGSFENRMRFFKEIMEEVRKVLPEDVFLAVRMNVMDDVEGGITLEEGKEMARCIESMGADAISFSAGTYSCKFTLIEPQLFEEGCRTSWDFPDERRSKYSCHRRKPCEASRKGRGNAGGGALRPGGSGQADDGRSRLDQ